MTASMPLHDDREDWTEPHQVTDLVLAIARGELDAWSGAYLRAGLDDLATLREQGLRGRARRPARTLGVRPWGHDDPV